jgi:hypothetical protein
VIECVATDSALVAHVAMPLTAGAVHKSVAASKNDTVPVGVIPVTVAVNVTL